MKLTPADQAFLKKNNATVQDVCDIRHIDGVEERYEYIKAKGKRYGYGDPCTIGGHRLKHRSGGHCGPCNPNAHVWSGRYTKQSCVYIAGSLSKRYMKIGMSDDPKERIRALRWMKYALAGDWELLFHVQVPDAGRVEHDATSLLHGCKLKLGYMKDGRKQVAIEVVQCNFEEAYDALRQSVTNTLSSPEYSKSIHRYNFK